MLSSPGLRIIGWELAGLIFIVLGIRFAFGRMLNTGGVPADAVQKTVTSRDGTVIAYEQTGAGPVLILVSAALVDRDGTRPLARQLASSFTVVNYDRRGRGKSTNTQPFAVEREFEDLECLVSAVGAPVYLFGSSSGAVLVLDAASRLGLKVKKLFLYEPPFIVDDSRPAIPAGLIQEVDASLAANKRDQAVEIFFTKAMGIPAVGVMFMRLLMPAWRDMTKVAHTAPYDLMILAGTQSGQPLPAERWKAETAPVLVAVGARSEPFFHTGAKALQGILPAVQYRSLASLDHGAVLMAPQVLAQVMKDYFGNLSSVGNLVGGADPAIE